MSNSYIQNNFSGGMNLFDDSSKLKPEEYYLLINGRNRNNKIEPVKLPKLIQGFPSGNIQGIYTAAPYLIIFIGGKAYVKNYQTNSQPQKIQNFQMDANVQTLYMTLVPASYINFRKSLVSVNINGNSTVSGVNYTGIIGGSPRCAIVQDGINQPWIINSDGTARVTKNYTQWSLADSEYVPIGSLMLWSAGILYILAKDSNGLYTNILHSCTGRPLDFMVAVKPNGDKTDLSESLGGAQILAHRVSYDELTCMVNVSTAAEGGFYVGTINNSYYVKPNFNKLLFGEPTYDTIPLFPTGPLNNFSVLDVLGDTTFIDTEGIKSFNSVNQTQNESRLDPFSLKIDNLFGNLVQNITAAVGFDKYAIYAVRTIYGDGLMIYDTTRGSFSSLDIYPNVGQIKQFASFRFRNIRKLFFVTTDDQLFEAFAGDSYAGCKYTTREWSSESPSNEQVDGKARLVFNNIIGDGIVYLTSFADRFHKSPYSESVIANIIEGLPGGKVIPYGINSDNQTEVNVSFDDKVRGSKLSLMVEFDFQAELTQIELIPEMDENI